MRDVAFFVAGAALGGASAAVVAEWRDRRRGAELGRMLSFAAHELNTPVTAVNMTVMNLLAGVFGELSAGHRPWLEMTREQVTRLAAVLGELRDFTHLTLKGDFRPSLEVVRPEALLEQAAGSVRRGFEQAGAPLELSIPDGLPALRCDAERASRSLASLLFHARKFRLGGAVRVEARAAGPGVVFAVSYAGSRLPPGEAARSLELGYPGRERSDQILAATGLGLGVVRLVLERTGGSLSFQVKDDGRSELAMSLPRAA